MIAVLEYAIQIAIQTLNASTPLLLAATGEIVAERSGIANIGVEGMMLISAFMAILGTSFANDPYIGLALALLTGTALGMLLGYLSAYAKGNQIVTGVGINLFAMGFVAYSIIAFFHVAGYYTIPIELSLPKVYGLSVVAPASIAVAILTYLFLYRTQTGLAIRACGENPEAADSVGIRVELVQMLSAGFGGLLAGAAGAFLSIGWLASITKQITAGRGFIALAIVNFANWNPLLGLAGSLLFGFFWVIGEWAKNIAWLSRLLPMELLNTLPYVATLAIVAGVIGRSRPPKYVGVPYTRE